ncbi:MAG: flavin reductase family protein [Candidatus Avilachnospira sp.]
MSFREIKPEELNENVFKLIGKDWMLITAGSKDNCNTMTASWGAMGIMWGKPSVTCYIRQSRYTKEFVDREEYFTISVFDEEYRKALNLCGTVSGRDRDKIKEAGLTVCEAGSSVAFEEAKIIIVCKKEYAQFMGPENFTEKANDERWYEDKDYHTMYIGSIEKILIK